MQSLQNLFIYLYLIKFNKISLPNWNNCCLITKYISLEIETWKRNKRSDTSHKYSRLIRHHRGSVMSVSIMACVGAGVIMAAPCNLFRSVIVFPPTLHYMSYTGDWLGSRRGFTQYNTQIRGKQINIYRNHPAMIWSRESRRSRAPIFFAAALCKW